MLEVCEIFYSLQGEGIYTGRPSLFLRLGGCNLSCEGFGVEVVKNGTRIIGCDSIHAVNKEHFRSTWKRYDSSEVLIREMRSHIPNKKPFDIVLTGGEPTLFFSNPVLIDTLGYFITSGCDVTVETNGTVLIDFERFPIYRSCTYALAVKLSNSGENEERRINRKALERITKNGRVVFFKFVLDAKMIRQLAGEIAQVTAEYDLPVYCMPLGESADVMAKNDKAVFELCVQNGYRYSDRAHIRVWGKKGGV